MRSKEDRWDESGLNDLRFNIKATTQLCVSITLIKMARLAKKLE